MQKAAAKSDKQLLYIEFSFLYTAVFRAHTVVVSAVPRVMSNIEEFVPGELCTDASPWTRTRTPKRIMM